MTGGLFNCIVQEDLSVLELRHEWNKGARPNISEKRAWVYIFLMYKEKKNKRTESLKPKEKRVAKHVTDA